MLASSGLGQAQTPGRRPNVILIISDQFRADNLGCMGMNPMNLTPNLDAMARKGTLFRSAFVNQPVCAPARATMFTGQYPEPLASRYEDVRTCPDELLLFFHHVAYDHVLQSGSTVLQHIYDTHFLGYAEVEAIVARWRVIAERFEPTVRENITTRFEAQLANAREWRDQVNTFFYRLSGVPDAHGRTIHR